MTLPEENRREIRSLISYINDVLLIRINDLTEDIRRLEKSTVKRKYPKIDLEIYDTIDGKKPKRIKHS